MTQLAEATRILYGQRRADEKPRNTLTHPDLPMPRMKVTLVSGPPGSGKSTYVAKRRSPQDVVIDLDDIKAEISGSEMHQSPDDRKLLKRALKERNRRLSQLAEADDDGACAWFICGSPKAADREHWRTALGADVVVLATPLDEIEDRLQADASRSGREEEMATWAGRWWSEYEPDDRDTVLS